MFPDTARVYSRIDLLYTVTRELNAAGLDIDQVLNRILAATVAAVGASDASLFLFEASGELENFILISDFKVEQRSEAAIKASLQHGLTGWVKQHREAALIPDTSVDERWYPDDNLPGLANARSAVAVPIQLPDQLIGILFITAPQVGHFDQSDLAMLSIIADQAGFAIANARLFKAEKQRRQFANTLTSITKTINSTLDLNEVLNLILDQLALVIDSDSSSIMLRDENADSLSVRAAQGFRDMKDALSVTIPLDENTLNNQAIRQKRPLRVDDVTVQPKWKSTSSTKAVRSWIGAPLVAFGNVIGMLTVDSHKVNQYTEESTEIVAAFAEHAATAVANAQAVTRLQDAEASYTALFEDSTDLILITNYQGRILNANRKACQMLRHTKEAIIGNDINFIHPDLGNYLASQSKRLERWREALIELDVKDAYSHTISLELKARQVYYDGIDCVAWAGRDISVRKEAERMRQDLVNMLIHDLRGPLGNIINTIELLPMLIESSEDMATLNNLLEMAKHNGQVVRDLIDSMLDVSRLEQGGVPFQYNLVEIDQIIEAMKNQVKPRADIKQMSLIIEPLPDIPPLWIDGSMIRRVLINLVDNAIKYTPQKGNVWVTTTLIDETLTFAISDNGPGISKSDQMHIFDKFSRVGESVATASGVGLGLAFCKLATEAHGGTITVESEGVPGQGCTFSITIPVITEPKKRPLE
jgi:PAS domain S-box-containing protein